MNMIKAEINFNQSNIITIKQNDIEYVAMRSIVEGIGLDWAGQQKKLSEQQDIFNCRHIATVAVDGKKRKLLCIPLKKLNGWLFSINPKKVNAQIRDKIIKYQEECFTALYSYWNHGKAARMSHAEQEAHEIVKFDELTFKEASAGSCSMNKRKKAKKQIKQSIEAWQAKYQLSFNYELTNVKAVGYAE